MAHPDFLLDVLTQRQLNEWLAFHQLSPIGERRADVRSAIQTAHLRRAWVEGEDDSPDTFLPNFPLYSGVDFDESPQDVADRERREASQFR